MLLLRAALEYLRGQLHGLRNHSGQLGNRRIAMGPVTRGKSIRLLKLLNRLGSSRNLVGLLLSGGVVELFQIVYVICGHGNLLVQKYAERARRKHVVSESAVAAPIIGGVGVQERELRLAATHKRIQITRVNNDAPNTGTADR